MQSVERTISVKGRKSLDYKRMNCNQEFCLRVPFEFIAIINSHFCTK